MARKTNIENFLGSLLTQISGEIARGVTLGLERSGLLGTLKKVSGKPGRKPTRAVNGRKRSTKKKKPSTCSVKGCGLPARTKGLCTKHYQQKRYAEMKKTKVAKKPAAKARLKKATSKPGAIKKAKGKVSGKKARVNKGTCKIAGCSKPVHARGLCGKHFMEWVRSRKS